MTDILFDTETGDVIIENGDLKVGDPTFYHVHDLLMAERGFYKFNPTIGISISQFINEEVNSEELIRQVRLGLERDGFKVVKLVLNNDGTFDIDGNY